MSKFDKLKAVDLKRLIRDYNNTIKKKLIKTTGMKVAQLKNIIKNNWTISEGIKKIEFKHKTEKHKYTLNLKGSEARKKEDEEEATKRAERKKKAQERKAIREKKQKEEEKKKKEERKKQRTKDELRGALRERSRFLKTFKLNDLRNPIPKKKIIKIVEAKELPENLEDILALGIGKTELIDEPIVFTGFGIFNLFMFYELLKKHKNDCFIVSIDKEDMRIRKEIKPKEYSIVMSPVTGEIISLPVQFSHFKGTQLANTTEQRNRYFFEKIKDCFKRNKLIAIPLSYEGHQNMIIINGYLNTVEHFEPHGGRYGGGPFKTQVKRSDKVAKSLKDFFEDEGAKYGVDLIFLRNSKLFRYLGDKSEADPSRFVDGRYRGFQSYEARAKKKEQVLKKGQKASKYGIIRDAAGYCVAWSFFYMDLRFTYPKVPAQKLLQRTLDIFNYKPEVLRRFIRGYTKIIAETFSNILTKEGLPKDFINILATKKKKTKAFWDNYFKAKEPIMNYIVTKLINDKDIKVMYDVGMVAL